MKCTKRSDRT